jgi:hypothetical protein
MSQSAFEISFSVVGTSTIIKGEIVRLHSPFTIQTLLDNIQEKGSFTVRSRSNIGLPKSYLMLFVDLHRGSEKQEHTNIQIGDIVYCPRQDAIFVIYAKPKISLPVYYLGKITQGMDFLPSILNGSMISIKVREIAA